MRDHARSEWGCEWHAIKLLPGEVCSVCRRMAGEWKQEEADRGWQAFCAALDWCSSKGDGKYDATQISEWSSNVADAALAEAKKRGRM